MEQKISSCAFTGHRPRSFSFGEDESSPEFLVLREKIKNSIVQMCNSGCRTFYCGMAEGVDLWCGELVLELQNQFQPPLELCAVVPFLDQPRTMSPLNQKRYRLIMDAANERFLVSREYKKFCFAKRNRFMVDSSDALIAVYRKDLEKTGTGQTVRYAEKKKKRIIIISP